MTTLTVRPGNPGEAQYGSYNGNFRQLSLPWMDADNVTGSYENDRLQGYGGADSLSGGDGDDIIFGSYDSIYLGRLITSPPANDGNDSLWGGGGDDYLDGQDANDDLHGDTGNDSLFGGAGNDIVFGDDGDDTLYGGDYFIEDSGDDTLYGGNGDDSFIPGSGTNIVDGGDGQDTLFFELDAQSVTVQLDTGTATISGYSSNNLVSIEEVYGTNSGDYIYGNYLDNTLTGRGGLDLLDGGEGLDTAVFFGDRIHYIVGFGADDAITISDNRDQAQINRDSIHNKISDGEDLVSNIEFFRFKDRIYTYSELVYGSTEEADFLNGSFGIDRIDGQGGDDIINGFEGDDILNGGDGDDWINGESGSNIISGGDGDDWIDGGSGSNIISGGNGDDTVSYAFSGNLDANLATGVISFPGNSTSVDQLDTIENFIAGGGDDVVRGDFVANSLSGSDGDDRLYGEAGEDRVAGGTGDDRLYGGDDNDRLFGGSGEDRLSGEAGDDRLAGATGTDRLYGGDGNDRMFGNSGDDRLYGGNGDDSVAGGTGSDRLFGSDGDDFLYGEASNDILSGGNGNDLLVGGPGTDQLTGGRGRDVFFFASEADVGRLASRDVILGFASRWDIIDISDIDANTLRGGNQGFTYIAGDDFSSRAGELRLFNGVLLADTDGNGYSDFQIEVEGRIRSSDLLL